MKDDLIRRQTAITAIQKAYADTEGGADRCAVWKNVGLTNALHIMQDLSSAQPEHLVKESGNLVKGLVNDCISRQAAKDALAKFVPYAICDESTESYTNGLTDAYNLICQLPSAQPEPISEEYAKAVRTWLINYQVRCAELNGRYTPYEILGWIVSDWRKENEIW